MKDQVRILLACKHLSAKYNHATSEIKYDKRCGYL